MIAIPVMLGAYLLGSLPFSYWVARSWGISDVRQVGSGNVGATNVMRSVGKLPGVLALALDLIKGVGAVLLSRWLGGPAVLQAGAATAAILGHMFPIWLDFRGGKGVATGAGAFLILTPVATAVSVGVFALTLATVRYVSVASMVAAWTLAVVAVFRGAPASVSAAASVNAALIMVKHRSNLARLRKGQENRVGSGRR